MRLFYVLWLYNLKPGIMWYLHTTLLFWFRIVLGIGGFYFHLNFRNPLPIFYEECHWNSDGSCIKCASHFQQHGVSFCLPVSSVSFFSVPKFPLWESFIVLARFILSYAFFLIFIFGSNCEWFFFLLISLPAHSLQYEESIELCILLCWIYQV